jgi:ketosteroid isomerase-like protein
MISRRSMILALAASAAALSPALAHSPAPKADVSDVTKQLMQFREEMKAAIEAKDIAKLKAMYADSFTHTHGSGKVDGKDARIVSLLAKEPVIEDVTMSEVSVRVHGDTAILAAKSPILNVKENKHYDFRWIQVYVRVNGKWQLAASQATRLPVVS